ncbi:hypothetical protein G1K75_12670 [Tenacibaculum finnmarkense]|uniref:SUKH-3 domain-containing protein n=1 Tax=Tenacibaculum finnmarkense TaxID=2781243 RepID=UPI001EFB8EDF|nr:SUKH-3 domain-containing protein [Tenacibaculum finnmarkense]MCG8806505.1 hypothetical protein [Tenacibaculum finnmarkense]MCG8857628.1 hypothetical protein [Tenacibaculum finnmarkense]
MGTINKMITENTLNILKNNSLIVEDIEELSNNDSYSKTFTLYYKNGYNLTDSLEEFLKYFANRSIKFKAKSGKDEVHFKTKRALKSNIRDLEDEYNIKGIVPIGMVYSEHMVLFSDERGWIYASYDSFVVLFGHSPFEGFNNLLSNRILKEFDFHKKNDNIDINKLFKVEFEKTNNQNLLIPKYDFDLEEFEIENRSQKNEWSFNLDIGGQIAFFINEKYIVESITYSLALHHHTIVEKLPIYSVDRNEYNILKIDSNYVDDNISFNYSNKRFITDNKMKTFFLFLTSEEIYFGKQISENFDILISNNNEFIGFKITI